MAVERMQIEQILSSDPKVLPMQNQPTSPQPKPPETRAQVEAEYSALLAAFRVAARILAVRLFLFLSLLGSFALAIMATQSQSWLSVAVIALYAAVTTLPLSIIEVKLKGA